MRHRRGPAGKSVSEQVCLEIAIDISEIRALSTTCAHGPPQLHLEGTQDVLNKAE
jgi:hypothetical protein